MKTEQIRKILDNGMWSEDDAETAVEEIQSLVVEELEALREKVVQGAHKEQEALSIEASMGYSRATQATANKIDDRLSELTKETK